MIKQNHKGLPNPNNRLGKEVERILIRHWKLSLDHIAYVINKDGTPKVLRYAIIDGFPVFIRHELFPRAVTFNFAKDVKVIAQHDMSGTLISLPLPTNDLEAYNIGFLLYHELGHANYNHDLGERRMDGVFTGIADSRELEADRYALARVGFDMCIRFFDVKISIMSHRLESFESGRKKASARLFSRTQSSLAELKIRRQAIQELFYGIASLGPVMCSSVTVNVDGQDDTI